MDKETPDKRQVMMNKAWAALDVALPSGHERMTETTEGNFTPRLTNYLATSFQPHLGMCVTSLLL